MTKNTVVRNMCICMMRPVNYCIIRCCMLRMQQNEIKVTRLNVVNTGADFYSFRIFILCKKANLIK